MLIQVHDKERMTIVQLWRLIFKFTFDKKNCPYNAKKTVEDQLLKWNGFIQMNKAMELDKYGIDKDTQFTPIGQKGSILDEMEYQVGMMCSWVVREEKGDFQGKIEAYARAKIDYRTAEPMCKMFPESNNLRNMARGKVALAQNMKEFPEIYAKTKPLKTFFPMKGV